MGAVIRGRRRGRMGHAEGHAPALRSLALALALAVTTTVAACGGDDGSGPEENQVEEVELMNFQFSRPQLTIAAGTTVRWRNTTSTRHTVTPDGHSAWQAWETTEQGQTFEVTFDTPGTYPYYCEPHRSLGMTGTVIVQ